VESAQLNVVAVQATHASPEQTWLVEQLVTLPQCVNQKVQTCTYGCSVGQCLPQPTPNLTFTVTPLLVAKNGTLQVTWSTANVTSCNITGTNGDSWTGTNGTQTSAHITSQTIYTARCIANDGSILTKSATVNLIPTFCEPATGVGC